MYDADDSIWVGELTPYSWSGLTPFTPDEADKLVGVLVPSAARAAGSQCDAVAMEANSQRRGFRQFGYAENQSGSAKRLAGRKR